MNPYASSDEHQPVTWIRGHAIYATHFIVLVFVVSMLVTTIAMAAAGAGALSGLTFDSASVLRGQLWRIFTYGLVNPPDLWFAIDMLMIFWFGREVERFFGRRTFFRFAAGVYLLTPVLFTILGLRWPMMLAGAPSGFAFFIAFATLYPNAVMLFSLLAKWVAIVLVAIYALIAIANRNLVSLISLGATVGWAYGFVRYQQGHFTLPRFSLGKRRTHLRVLPDSKPKVLASPKPAAEDSMAEMDALLDKIARSGLSSLTAKERAKLDAAREQLLKRHT
jgi:hypothetical protein